MLVRLEIEADSKEDQEVLRFIELLDALPSFLDSLKGVVSDMNRTSSEYRDVLSRLKEQADSLQEDAANMKTVVGNLREANTTLQETIAKLEEEDVDDDIIQELRDLVPKLEEVDNAFDTLENNSVNPVVESATIIETHNSELSGVSSIDAPPNPTNPTESQNDLKGVNSLSEVTDGGGEEVIMDNELPTSPTGAPFGGGSAVPEEVVGSGIPGTGLPGSGLPAGNGPGSGPGLSTDQANPNDVTGNLPAAGVTHEDASGLPTNPNNVFSELPDSQPVVEHNPDGTMTTTTPEGNKVITNEGEDPGL